MQLCQNNIRHVSTMLKVRLIAGNRAPSREAPLRSLGGMPFVRTPLHLILELVICQLPAPLNTNGLPSCVALSLEKRSQDMPILLIYSAPSSRPYRFVEPEVRLLIVVWVGYWLGVVQEVVRRERGGNGYELPRRL